MEMKKRINLELRNRAPEKVRGGRTGGARSPRPVGPSLAVRAAQARRQRCRIWVSRGAGPGGARAALPARPRDPRSPRAPPALPPRLLARGAPKFPGPRRPWLPATLIRRFPRPQ